MWRGRLRPRVLRESGNFSRGLFDSRSSRERGGTRFLGVATWLCRVPGDTEARGPVTAPSGGSRRGAQAAAAPASAALPRSWTSSRTASSPSSPTPATPARPRTAWLTPTRPAGSWLWPTPSCCSGTAGTPGPHGAELEAGCPPHPRPSRCFGASGPCLRSQRGLTAGSGPPADVWTCRRAEWPAGLGQSSRAVTTSDSAEPRWEGPERPQERAVSA